MSRNRLGLLAGLAVAAAALAPAVAMGGASSASGHTVVLKALRYHPGDLTVRRGESVTWVWRDGEEHNVTAHAFHSHTMTHGSFTVHFIRSGTFDYRCTIHEAEGMRGTIVVH
jgi:plastocyanin